jgi:hypothetical protein
MGGCFGVTCARGYPYKTAIVLSCVFMFTREHREHRERREQKCTPDYQSFIKSNFLCFHRKLRVGAFIYCFGRCLRPGHPFIRLQALGSGRYPLLSLTLLCCKLSCSCSPREHREQK